MLEDKNWNFFVTEKKWILVCILGIVDNFDDKNLSVDQDNEIQYHEFRLPKDCIKIVDNIIAFDEFLDALKGVNIVGIDSEWKPSFG